MRMTSKGQVTIPKHIRERLNLAHGDEVNFKMDGEKVLLLRGNEAVKVCAADELIKQLETIGRSLDRIPMTTDELMNLTRGPFNDIDAH